MTINLLLADDHTILRNGLKHFFATRDDLSVGGEASSAQEVLDILRSQAFDLLLLDLNMPGISGLDLLKRLHSLYPQLPILILSMHKESEIVSRALKLGASGYLTKTSEPEILLSAIQKVSRGGKFIDPTLVDAMVFEQSSDESPYRILSDRELQVLQLLAAGKHGCDIARQLKLSEKTVSTHKTRMMQKLGIDNTVELIRYAMRHDIVAD
jgi:DNA-binding NarL/FixJ family response regulator